MTFLIRVTDRDGTEIIGQFQLLVEEPPPPEPVVPRPPLPRLAPILRLALDNGPELVLTGPMGEPGLDLLHVTEVDYGYPEVREVSDPRPQADGMLDRTKHTGTRVVSVTGKVAIDWASQGRRQELADALAPFLRPGVRPWLYSRFDDGRVRRILLRADDFTSPQIANVRDVSLSYKSPTGVFEGEDENSLRLVPEVPIQGRRYNLVHPRTYPPGSGTTWLADNRGNTEAEWVARIFGPCNGPAVVNARTGEQVSLARLRLNEGDFVEVSSRDHTVLAGGIRGSSRWNMVDFATTTWWKLPGRTVTPVRFRCTPEGYWRGWDPPAMTQFTWRDTSLL